MAPKKTAVIVIILLATFGLTSLASHSERIAPNRPFEHFPMQVGEYKGVNSSMDEKVYNILGVEDYLMADYRKATGELVNIYVGFYQSQKQGDIIHSPKNCMPGAGWNITRTSVIEVPIEKNNESIKAIKLLLQKGGQQQVVLYWFQSRGRIIASEYMQKIWLVVDSIVRNRTDGSFVRLISPVTEDEQAAEMVLKDFAGFVYPLLREYIPE